MCLGRDWLAAIAASQPSGGTLPGSDQWEAGPVARARPQAKSVSVIYGWWICLSTPPPQKSTRSILLPSKPSRLFSLNLVYGRKMRPNLD